MREIIVDDIGKINFVKSRRAKNISISVRPLKGVKVTLPYFVCYNEAEKVIAHKKDWIIRNLGKVRELEKNHTIFTEEETYQTRFHKLIMKRNGTEKVSVRVQSGKIILNYPSQLSVESDIIQSAIRKGIERAFKIEANEYLPLRVKQLAEKFELTYENVSVKNVKSRWGSCSRRKNINLNIHLMRLPDHLIDYVILHELAHTVELNHSKRFWNLLDSLTGCAKLLDKELKNYRVSIY